MNKKDRSDLSGPFAASDCFGLLVCGCGNLLLLELLPVVLNEVFLLSVTIA